MCVLFSDTDWCRNSLEHKQDFLFADTKAAIQDALCSTLFPCCTTVGAEASSAIMKGHWSAGPHLLLHTLQLPPPPNKAPQSISDSCFTAFQPLPCRDYFNKGNTK